MGVQGLQSLKKDLRNFRRRLNNEPKDAAVDGLERVERSAKGNLIQNDSVASTSLWRSFEIAESQQGDIWSAELINYAPHAKYVEFGTGDKFRPNPHTQPFPAPSMSPHLVSEIKKWMIVKPSFVPYNDINEAAIRISMVISGNADGKRSGTPAQPFFLPAWRTHRREVRESIEASVSRAVRRV